MAPRSAQFTVDASFKDAIFKTKPRETKMSRTVAFVSQQYFIFVALLACSFALNMASVWATSPRMVLQANPFMKRIGWCGAIAQGFLASGLFAMWPLAAVFGSTALIMMSARNFHDAWLMRVCGEENYRAWAIEHFHNVPLSVSLLYLCAQALPIAVMGAAVIYFSRGTLIALGIGIGIVYYAFGVAWFSARAMFKAQRSR
jgi:hypothetical protein